MTLDIREFVRSPKVSDGAWGTQLQQRGLEAGAVAELWNVDNRPAVEEVAKAYVDAGADVIISNTFGSNRICLDGHGLGDRAAELTRAGAEISRDAAGDSAKVFASIGPTGKIVMMGEISEQQFIDAFAECAEALAAGGADAIVLETFNELAEIELALRAARQATDLPIVCSMTYSSGPDKTNTMMGSAPAELAKMAEANGASAVGANCGVGPDNYVKVAKLYAEATDLPVWIKSNAGLPVIKDGETTFPMGPDEFGQFAPALVQAGASIIGGCCGTTPQHIAETRKAIDAI